MDLAQTVSAPIRQGASMPSSLPFDGAKLDALLDEAGLDVVLATSPHNVRYLLGGYRFFLYDRLDPIGPSRYLPVVGYLRGRPDDAFYVGAANEDWGTDVHTIWTPAISNVTWTTIDAAEHTAAQLRLRGAARLRIGIEPPYLPSDAMAALSAEMPSASFGDATDVLDELRGVKSAEELEIMRTGSDAVVDAMLATFQAVGPGMATAEVVERLRLEETRRGLTFAYALVAAAADHNRAPSARKIEAGGVLSLDSGADLAGYTADLTRMAVAGEPTDRQDDLLDQVDAVQRIARSVVGPGRRGGDLFDVTAETIEELPDGHNMSFLAHGTGLLTHEAPRLTATGSPPYPATHRDRPLEAGMVISIETHIADPEAGFIKLEDTVIVTPDGHEAAGDRGRGWNRLGA